MKKIAAILGAGAMLLTMVGPAFARQSHHSQQGNSNVAFVNSTTDSQAVTGYNNVSNNARVRKACIKGDVEIEGENDVTTGNAQSEAIGVVAANTQVGCSTCGRRSSGNTSNVAFVNNTTSSYAGTGDNVVSNNASVSKASIGGHRSGGEVEIEGENDVTTGNAESTAVGVVVVNTQWNN